MIINGLKLDGATFEADVCVIGAGAAGLTLALQLAEQGVSVVVVESGGLEFSWRSHKLLEVEHAGDGTEKVIEGTRERFFGGTTNHWGGVCRPFSDFEFQAHDWVPGSGWPIKRADLDPYYDAAAQLLDLPETQRDYDATALGVAQRKPLVTASENTLQQIIWRHVSPERLAFGRWRREEVKEHPLVTCVLNTSIAELWAHPSGTHIVHAEGRTHLGDTLRFRAKDYALCTGAIENARLLLASDTVVPGGLGNAHDLVGRYFMDHPGHLLGYFMPTDPQAPLSQEMFLAQTGRAGWITTQQVRRERRLLGFQAFLMPNPLRERMPQELGMRHLIHSPFDPLGNGDAARRQPILLNFEQSPTPESRVMLSKELDPLGVRKPILHWKVKDSDLESARQSAQLLSLGIARSGLGRLRIEDFTARPLMSGGGHQMGTTRMSEDPSNGVTDRDGRVHSVENLFVGGSSLFTTGGWQHPTFTIVALALRQADHIARRHTKQG